MRTPTILILVLAGCGGAELAPAELSQPILSGTSRDPRVFQVGVIIGSDGSKCSATFIDSDLALTKTSGCSEARDATIHVGGISSPVKVERVPASAPPLVAVLQTRAPLVSSGLPLDPVPLRLNEEVFCFGYGGGQLSSGRFRVADFDADGNYILRGLFNPIAGRRYATDLADLGGYCSRDSSVAAIITLVVEGGDLTLAAPVTGLVPALSDIRRVSEIARRHNSVSWVQIDRAITDLPSSPPIINLQQRVPSWFRVEQAWYIDELPVQPVTGWQVALLPLARDGRCLMLDRGGVPSFTLASCDYARRDQQFWVQYDGTSYRLRPLARISDCVDSSNPSVSPGVLAHSACNGRGSQAWAIWLNPY